MSPPCHAPAAPATSWTRIASATIETKNERSVASIARVSALTP